MLARKKTLVLLSLPLLPFGSNRSPSTVGWRWCSVRRQKFHFRRHILPPTTIKEKRAIGEGYFESALLFCLSRARGAVGRKEGGRGARLVNLRFLFFPHFWILLFIFRWQPSRRKGGTDERKGGNERSVIKEEE